jgi:Anaphase-promoting complex subunit 4 WD40 domain
MARWAKPCSNAAPAALAMVMVVACRLQEDLVAIGYNDGMILLVRFSDAHEVVLRRAGISAISALGWDKTGARLAFGSENGNCGVVDLRGGGKHL